MVKVYALEVASWGTPYSPARTVALPLSALVLAVLAVLGLLPDRDARRRSPKRNPFAAPVAQPRRAKLHTTLLTLAAVCSIAALVTAVCLFPRATTPAAQMPPPVLAPIDLPAAIAVGPGAGIYVAYADRSGGMGCTAGFLVHTSTGAAEILTAGHCNRPGQPSKVTMNLGGVLPYATVGTFRETIN